MLEVNNQLYSWIFIYDVLDALAFSSRHDSEH